MVHVSISPGNRKMGNIPSVSLPPIITCPDNAPCAKLCYARKMFEGYSRHAVGKTWTNNLLVYKDDPIQYFDEIKWFLQKNPPRYFRYHVGGDIPDDKYFTGMVDLAEEFPHTFFLAFTRREYRSPINNLILKQSIWLNEQPKCSFGNTMVIQKEQPAPNGYRLCPGKCDECHLCWDSTSNVAIHLH
jgi:hypothetical protein